MAGDVPFAELLLSALGNVANSPLPVVPFVDAAAAEDGRGFGVLLIVPGGQISFALFCKTDPRLVSILV